MPKIFFSMSSKRILEDSSSSLAISSEQHTPERSGVLVQIACDYLGITKIDREAISLVEEITRETMKKTIQLARKWAQRSGRRNLRSTDFVNALNALQGSTLVSSIVPLIETFRSGVSQFTAVAGTSDLFCTPNGDVDLDGHLPNTDLVPRKPRLKTYFFVKHGNLVKSAYTIRTDEDCDEDIDLEEQKKVEKFADHSVQWNPSSTLMFLEAAKHARGEQIVGLKPNVVEMLTVEQQLFMKDILTVCMGQDDKKRYEALLMLEYDSGLQALLPSLINIVCKSISANISQLCLSLTIYCNRILRSIILNKSVDLSMMIHNILPALLSCCVGRNICLRPETDNHWALRDFSYKTLTLLIKDHINQDAATEFSRRIFQFAWNVFKSPDSTAPMIYGSIGILADYVHPDRIQWLIEEFRRMMERYRIVQNEAAGRPGCNLVATEAVKLCQMLHRYEAGLRGRTTLSQK